MHEMSSRNGQGQADRRLHPKRRACHRIPTMMRLKNLLTLLILSGSRISVAAFSDGSSAGYAFLVLVATVLLAAVFVLLSSPTRGKEDAFELGSSFLLSGLPALAAIFSAALVIFQMNRNLCNLFRGCSWSFAFWIHTPNFIFSLVGNIFVFSATILAASFIAQLTKTMLRFRDGMVSGCFAFHSFLKSRRLKCALT